MSALTRASQIRLSHAMSLDDLEAMSNLYISVIEGNTTVEGYQEKEKEMIKKYGFKIK